MSVPDGVRQCAYCGESATVDIVSEPAKVTRKDGAVTGIGRVVTIPVCANHERTLRRRRITYENLRRIKNELAKEKWGPRQQTLFTPVHTPTPHHRKDVQGERTGSQ